MAINCDLQLPWQSKPRNREVLGRPSRSRTTGGERVQFGENVFEKQQKRGDSRLPLQDDIYMYHWEVNIGGVEFHVDLFVDERLAVFVVVLPDPGHGHPDLDWAAFFRRRREETETRLGGRGEDLGPSLESLSQKGGFWGVARVTLCYWTGLDWGRPGWCRRFLTSSQLA